MDTRLLNWINDNLRKVSNSLDNLAKAINKNMEIESRLSTLETLMKIGQDNDVSLANRIIALENIIACDGIDARLHQPSAKPAETEREWIPVMPKKEINNMEIGLRKMEYIHKILCFTGSTKFKDKFWELHRMYTMAGYITLIPAIYAHCGDKVEDWQQKKLFELQIEKIKICDILFVVNVGGYLGESTLKEIDFARSLGKEINWLEKPPENAERLKAGYATIQEVTKPEPPVDNELRGA